MRTVSLVEPGWTERTEHGPVWALRYPDGSIRVEHLCKSFDDLHLITAPALQIGNGHTVVSDAPLTIHPSILCPDCGLHGFITNGEWV